MLTDELHISPEFWVKKKPPARAAFASLYELLFNGKDQRNRDITC